MLQKRGRVLAYSYISYLYSDNKIATITLNEDYTKSDKNYIIIPRSQDKKKS